jgi:hypothetical protein
MCGLVPASDVNWLVAGSPPIGPSRTRVRNTAVVRALEDGERAAASTAVPALKAKSEETGGAFLLFEDRMDHGKVTPLYIHPTL